MTSPTDAIAATARRCALCFYCVAAVSILNSVAALLALDVAPLLGLGITRLHDQLVLKVLVSQAAGMELVLLRLIGPLVTLHFAAALIFLGWHARKLARWAFVGGITFYGLDTLTVLLTRDWLSVALHLAVLAILGFGLHTARRIPTCDVDDESGTGTAKAA